MDGNLVLMVIFVVGMAMTYAAYEQREKTKRKAMEASEGDSALEGRVAALEERVKVLERIQTDPSERLKRELESL